MTQEPDKIAHIRDCIIRDVTEYWDVWKNPLAFEMISRRYGVLVRKLTGLPLEELIRTLDAEGKLHFTVTARGKRVALPLNEEMRGHLANGTIVDVLFEYDKMALLRSRIKGSR